MRGCQKGVTLQTIVKKQKRGQTSWFKETHLNLSYLGRTWYRSSSDLRFSSRKACILSSAICSRLFAYSSIRKSRMSRKFSPDIPLIWKRQNYLSPFLGLNVLLTEWEIPEDKCFKLHLMHLYNIHKIVYQLTIKDITLWFSNMTEF